MSGCCLALIERHLYFFGTVFPLSITIQNKYWLGMLLGGQLGNQGWFFSFGWLGFFFPPVLHWIKPKFPNIFFSTAMKMFYPQHFLITAAGIYGSSWKISKGSVRCNWEKQVCSADIYMCCSGLPSSAGKHLRVSNWECFKIALSHTVLAKIRPITCCNYNLQTPTSMLIKWFLFHLHPFSCVLGKLFTFLYASVSFLEKAGFSEHSQEDFGREAVHIYKVHWTGK